MKKRLSRTGVYIGVIGMLACCMSTLMGCPIPTGDETEIPSIYKDFYNYPDGRKNPNALFGIENKAASTSLLFTDAVLSENYIGTVGSLSSIKVKLPEEKFYTIIAVDKANYEEHGEQASQYSSLAYYSNTQAFSVSVTPANTSGGGTWYFNNKTSFWVQIKEANLSGKNFAVLPPGAERVFIPITIGEKYDFIPYFSKEIKYGGRVMALVETTDKKQADTASTTNEKKTFTTDIKDTDVKSDVKPAIIVKNTSGKTVRVYYSKAQMSNGSVSGDFVIISGDTQFITGFDTDDDTKNINFSSIAWDDNKYISKSMSMQNNKVYEITLDSDGTTTVTEVDSGKYYN